MQCDMCDSAAKVKASIEGAEMNVCDSCASFGRIISKVVTRPTKKALKRVVPRTEKILLVKKNFSDIIKSKRETLGLKQEEFAKQIAEKTSVVHQLETGHLKPNVDLARKIEKFLNVSLLEEYEEKYEGGSSESEGLTIGDFIKIR